MKQIDSPKGPTLIFDLGGVVFDWDPNRLLKDLCAEIALNDHDLELVRNAVFEDYGLSADWISFDRGIIDSKALSVRIAKRLRSSIAHLNHINAQKLSETSEFEPDALTDQIAAWVDKIGPALEPIPATVSLLKRLHAQAYRLMFLSNMPAPFIPHLKRHKDVFQHFTDGIFSSDVLLVKPEREIFSLADSRFSPEAPDDPSMKDIWVQKKKFVPDFIFIDDSAANTAAARQHGWQTVQFISASQATVDLDRLLSSVGPSNRRVRSFVIRAGRMGSGQLKALKALAPQYVIDMNHSGGALSDHWPIEHRQKPLLIEIGFGMGETLASVAREDRSRRYLGIEVHPPGIGSMLQHIEANRLDHVRLIQHDAVEVLQSLIPDETVAAFHIYFPDPWPKKRHHKRRLIQSNFVSLLASRLKPGGYLHCATDWEPYARSMLEVLSAEAGLSNLASGYHQRPHWRPMTNFEARGLRLGHVVKDLLFQKNPK